LGPYQIVAHIGAGGMGEVYQARDTRLKRNVALKVLPESVAKNPQRRARFQHEAEVLAALNHPNIAAIYGIEESTSTTALVMELVEGVSLADKIRGRGLRLAETLDLAIQIANGLEAAHKVNANGPPLGAAVDQRRTGIAIVPHSLEAPPPVRNLFTGWPVT